MRGEKPRIYTPRAGVDVLITFDAFNVRVALGYKTITSPQNVVRQHIVNRRDELAQALEVKGITLMGGGLDLIYHATP